MPQIGKARKTINPGKTGKLTTAENLENNMANLEAGNNILVSIGKSRFPG